MEGMTWGPEHTQVTHQLCLLCCSCSAAAMAHGPPRTFLLFCFERRHGHECSESGSGRHELWKV